MNELLNQASQKDATVGESTDLLIIKRQSFAPTGPVLQGGPATKTLGIQDVLRREYNQLVNHI